MGSPRNRTVDTGAFRVTEIWFPPGAVLDAHTHDRSLLSVVLQGSITTTIGARRIECGPASGWTEPREEMHANRVGPVGARILVTQPDPERTDLIRPFAGLLNQVNQLVHPALVVEARRVAGELARPDSLSHLVADAHIVLVMARAMRFLEQKTRQRRPPPWLQRARDIVHEGFRGRLDLCDIAAASDVTPWHLARTFRQFFHESIGEYARALRLDWGLERLLSSDDAISAIALAAGYADQSHFTRACSAATGLAPGEYRRRSLL